MNESYERNETEWWSHWARLRWISDSCYIITSRHFKEYLFNHIGVIKPREPESCLDEESKFIRLKVNPSFFIPDEDEYSSFLNELKSSGYKRVDSLNVMKLNKRRMMPSSDVDVEEVTERGLLEWVRVYLQSFYTSGFYREKVYRAVISAMKEGNSKFFLARVRGLPVGCTAVHFTDNVAGAYCVGVIPEYRKMHVASTILHYASKDESAKRREFVLQTFESDHLLDFYMRLGFQKLYAKKVLSKMIFMQEEETPIQQGISIKHTSKRIKLGVEINRELQVDKYRFSEAFKGFEKNPALLSVFGDELEKVLNETYIIVDPREGYLHVDNEKGWIYLSQPYLKYADERYIYLDLIHEVVHVKQFMEGKNLYDWRYEYFERPTEVEAYKVTVEEAKRIGMTDDEIAEYLKVEWAGEDEFRSFLKKMNLKSRYTNIVEDSKREN